MQARACPFVIVTLEYGKDNGQILFHLRRAEELDDQRVRANPSSREAKLYLSFDYSQDANFQVSRKKDLPSALALFRKNARHTGKTRRFRSQGYPLARPHPVR